AIPAGGEPGDFGLAAAGDFQDDALVDCATRIIQKRGGRPVVAPLGAFRTVKDAASPAGGEIAVKKGGPLLLGAGPYLRAMIDAAEGRTAAIRTSQAHAMLARAVGEGALRLTFVLTQEQRSALKSDLDRGGSIVAGGLAIGLGPEIRAHGVLECPTADACADVARSLVAAKEARAGDLATRIVGFGDVLDRTTIEPEGAFVHVRVEVSAEEAGKLVDTAVKLGAFRHPMPTQAASAEPRASASASPPPPSAGASASPPRAAASAAPSASARSKPR
ncbi:MAG TPA: hypothetical protein VHB21_10685, partial [Minicystis sp.]|nr:hypothetical protein [Minicystis sp.]